MSKVDEAREALESGISGCILAECRGEDCVWPKEEIDALIAAAREEERGRCIERLRERASLLHRTRFNPAGAADLEDAARLLEDEAKARARLLELARKSEDDEA